jgi:serine protease Do
MRRLPIPDWLLYAGVVGALLALALSRREPSAPGGLPSPRGSTPAAAEGGILAPASPNDPSVSVDVPARPGAVTGTAFSVGSTGLWVTARHVVDGCHKAALVVSEGRGVEATPTVDPQGEAATLETDGGAPALPLAPAGPLRVGEIAYHLGFPQGRPGEASSRLIGRENLEVRGHGARTEPVLVWAEVSRSAGLSGSLGGLSGAPALDAQGRVIAVTIAEAPRRGRIYTTTPETLARVVTAHAAGGGQAARPAGVQLTSGNYRQVADTLRHDLRVAQLVCLS